MDKHLHIISLDVPFPADYGGVIDIFNRLKALHAAGIKIHLHCFSKNMHEQPELDAYCESVVYYPRKRYAMSFSTPYIVVSRQSKQLLQNLQDDNYPILMEGIHCTGLLNQLRGRRLFIRLHNIEHAYYQQLAKNESHFLKKIYFSVESVLLRRYEKKLANKAVLLSISESDATLMQTKFKATRAHTIPAFHSWGISPVLQEEGCFCLYHGNLSINENEAAATWLLTQVFAGTDLPFVIAGKNPSEALQRRCSEQKNCCLVANPSEAEMQDLIKKAQVNILPSVNNAGTKLKVLNALFVGRHCVLNSASVHGLEVTQIFHVANTPAEMTEVIKELYERPFTKEEQEMRCNSLMQAYNNDSNAERLINLLY